MWDDETGRNRETRIRRMAKRAYKSRDFRAVWLTRRNGRLTLCALLYGGLAAIVYGWDDNPDNPGWNTMSLFYGPLGY